MKSKAGQQRTPRPGTSATAEPKTQTADTRQRRAQALAESELRYRRLFEAAQDGILILNAETGLIEDVNPYLLNMLGYSREEFLKKKLWEVGAFKDIEASKEAFGALQDNEYIRYEDLPLKAKDGRLIQVEFVSNVYVVGGGKVIQCDIRNVTEHKRIIAALQDNEKQYHDLVDLSPDGMFIIEVSGHIIAANKAMCRELGFGEEQLLSMNIWDIMPEEYLEQYRERLPKILEGKSLTEAAEYAVRGKDGKTHYVDIISAPHYSGKDIVGFQGIARDISERRRAEQDLHASEERYRTLAEAAHDQIFVVNRGGTIEYINHFAADLIQRRPEEVIGQTMESLFAPEMAQQQSDFLQRVYQTRQPFYGESRTVFPSGEMWIGAWLSPLFDEAGEVRAVMGIARDITERKQAEMALRESEMRYQNLARISPVGIFRTDPNGVTVYVNPMWCQISGLSADQALGEGWLSAVHPEDKETLIKGWQEATRLHQVSYSDYRFVRSDGTIAWVMGQAIPEMNSENQVAGYVGTITDITERKRAEERMRQQLQHLNALSAIDRVISANFDLGVSVSEILMHVTTELGVDAADVLVLDSATQILEFCAGRGFRTQAIKKTNVRLGESHAGRAALDRQLVQIPDLSVEPDNLLLTTLLAGEDFVCYYGVPLIAKGQVKGVLEVYHRTALEPDAEWLDLLNALAGQAAIAIENSMLFEGLQRTTQELTLAYDATIEGWSHALDLRDKETEGHTQRVTEMTLELARLLGLSEAELVQVRWGALLHDIGKMGVPDGILLKPGSLTDEEWVAMKKHPTFAYEMLAPIRYLRLALDIPYCHHEKWDGSGYPRGLKGDQIPLAARVFAVIDVWDALTSDRPYRKAWTREDSISHIIEQTGSHFDPEVVKVFLKETRNGKYWKSTTH